MRKTLFILTMTIGFFAAACGEDTTSTASEDATPTTPEGDDAGDTPAEAPAGNEVVFIWAETGGCAMAGPNCARYEVTAAGAVTTYREGETDVAATGTVDAARVQEWLAVVADTDVDELVGRLGPGEMTAAFDGTDYTLEAPLAGINLSSTDVEFAADEALFKNATQLAGLAADAAPLELQQR